MTSFNSYGVAKTAPLELSNVCLGLNPDQNETDLAVKFQIFHLQI